MSNIVKVHEGYKKLRAFTDNDWSKVGVQFIGLAGIMGLKMISPEDCKVMIDFVRDEFKDFSFTEIQTAFKMNLADKLPNAKGLKTEPYGSFNINYVGTVLGLYRKHRTLELRRVNKANPTPAPIKSDDQKAMELKNTMDEIFKELNDHFIKGVTSFTFVNGIKYYGCLKYFNIIPDYKNGDLDVAKSLWGKAKEQTLNNYMGSMDVESRKIISYLKGSGAHVSDELKRKALMSTDNNYKGLLVSKCLNDLKEFDFKDLNEAKK